MLTSLSHSSKRSVELTTILLAALCVPASKAQESLPKEVITSAHIRLKAEETFKQHSAYSCLESIRRTEQRSRSSVFKQMDSLLLEVTTIDGQEFFSWPGDREFSEHAPRELVAAGLSTSGEFLTHVKNVLLSNNATLLFEREDEVHGVKTLRYRFSLSQRVSGYRVFGQGQSAVVPTAGSIAVNAETLELIGLELRAADIPQALGISSVVSKINFAPVTLAGQRILLPESATVDFAENNGRISRNNISFLNYRQYSSNSSLSFDSQAPVNSDNTRRVPSATTYLPGGLLLTLGLTEPLTLKTAHIGDEIRAVLVNDVKDRQHLLISKGAVATGRVRLAESLQQPQPHLLLGLEFNEIAAGSNHMALLASLTTYTNLPSIDRSIRRETTRELALMNRGRLTITDAETTTPLTIPGVGTFVFPDNRAVLPVGFEMNWISMTPAKHGFTSTHIK